jgi:DNA invertase Pin-like site-specific DNA recombinase
MLSYVRDGDRLTVHSIDRLARNVGDLLELVDGLTKRGVTVEFVKESLTFSGHDAPINRLLLNVLGAVAQFERDLIRERQREGIAVAKKSGAFRGGTFSLTDAKAEELRLRAKAGEPKSALAREFGIDRTTVYRYLKIEGGN